MLYVASYCSCAATIRNHLYCNRAEFSNHVSNWCNTCEWGIIGVSSKSEFVCPPLPFCFKVCVVLCISKLSPICHRIKVRLKRPNWTAERIERVASAKGWTQRGVSPRLCGGTTTETYPQAQCGWSCLFHMTQPRYSFVSRKLFSHTKKKIPKQNAKPIISGDRETCARALHPNRWVEIFWLRVRKVAGKEKGYF